MKTVEFRKMYITGMLRGIRIVERIVTDLPEQWVVGKVVVE